MHMRLLEVNYYTSLVPYTKREIVDYHRFLKLYNQLIWKEAYESGAIVVNVVNTRLTID
jgi:hypothetical protein